MLLPLLWQLGRALLHDVAIKDNTSFNQAIKDPSQRRCGYSNLGKVLCSKICGCGACGCAYPAGKFACPDILRPEQKVALVRSQQNQPSSTSGFSTSRIFLSQIVLRSAYREYSHLKIGFAPFRIKETISTDHVSHFSAATVVPKNYYCLSRINVEYSRQLAITSYSKSPAIG
jgi:hypothetical protein